MERKVYVVFDTNNDSIEEMFELNHRFVQLVSLKDITTYKVSLEGCKGVLDCTNDFIFYNNRIKNKKGIELNSNENKYVKTALNNFIVKGVPMSRLVCAKYNSKLEEKQKENLNEYKEKLFFLFSLIPEIKNKLNFENGIKTTGIEISDEIINSNKKFVLVKVIPENPLPNVEYITPDDVFLLKDIEKLGEYIK